MLLPVFTIDDIRSWAPCYDPARYLHEGWQGTALDILDCEDCPAVDRLWAVLRNECIDARTLRLFAVWCSRQALALIADPDPRSVAAIDTAERFAVGEATVDELAAAWDASADAWDAARGAAWVAARAARDAASGAARDAARDAANAAAWAAARAAWDASADASAAAWDASADASAAASAAAWAAAWDAARDAQVLYLRLLVSQVEPTVTLKLA